MARYMTETNLRSAKSGKSQAYMRYAIYAERAEKAGFHNVSRLFDAVSFAEKVRASNHYRNILSRGAVTTVSAAIFGTRTLQKAFKQVLMEELLKATKCIQRTKRKLNFREKEGLKCLSLGLWKPRKSMLIYVRRPNKPLSEAETSISDRFRYATARLYR